MESKGFAAQTARQQSGETSPAASRLPPPQPLAPVDTASGSPWFHRESPSPLKTQRLIPRAGAYSSHHDQFYISDTEDPDTCVAIYAPPSFLADLVLRGGQLNVAATVARWLGPERRLLSFGAYTAELEVDIATGA